MIEIPRSVARQFRAVLRKCLLAPPRGPGPLILCRAGKHGLTVHCEQGDIGLRYRLAGRFAADAVALPMSVLADLEGRDSEVAVVEQVEPNKGRARWDEAGVPRALDFETTETTSLPTPVELQEAAEMPPGFLAALAEAARTASRDSARLALNCVLLRGRTGSVIATDGRQLLMQTGFQFPWQEDVLVPALPAFAARELADQPARLGRVGGRVLLEAGPWLFTLSADTASRYPDVDSVVPKMGPDATRIHLHPEDATALVRGLRRLPARDVDGSPVLLEAGPAGVVVRGEGVDLALPRSRAEGPPVRLSSDRRYLVRAAQLGFAIIAVDKPDRPVVCRDKTRTYVWMPLDSRQPAPGAARQPTQTEATPESQPQRRTPMSDRNGHHEPQPQDGSGEEPPDLLAEAEALRSLLQDGLARTSRLIAALRQHRRRNRALRAAMSSLERLKQLDP